MNFKALPIGSLVVLNQELRKVMIIGYQQKLVDHPVEIFDYVGCLYPEGYVSADKNVVFHEKDILQVYYLGFQNKQYLKEIKEKMEEIV